MKIEILDETCMDITPENRAEAIFLKTWLRNVKKDALFKTTFLIKTKDGMNFRPPFSSLDREYLNHELENGDVPTAVRLTSR
jgi:hypothetical protein